MLTFCTEMNVNPYKYMSIVSICAILLWQEKPEGKKKKSI